MIKAVIIANLLQNKNVINAILHKVDNGNSQSQLQVVNTVSVIVNKEHISIQLLKLVKVYNIIFYNLFRMQ